MSFRESVSTTSGLETAWKPGLQAVSSGHRQHISAASPRNLRGSVDIDSTLASRLPNANRWDYGIAYMALARESVLYLEVHPASATSNIKEVAAKLKWLREWLASTEMDQYPKRYIWISTGPVCFTQSDPKIKALALQGLSFQSRAIHI